MSGVGKPLLLRLMGRVELWNPEGERVHLPTRKVWLLLAVLTLLEGHPVHRSEIAEIVWPEGSPKSSRDSLRSALAMLRKALPREAIEPVGDKIRLGPGFVLWDERQLTGHEAYTGDFMPGFDADWVIDHRIRLRGVAARDALKQADRLWLEGDKNGALALTERASQIDPFDEEAAATRVRYLQATGRLADAITVSSAYRSKVLRDMGVLTDVRPTVDLSENPLVVAQDWLLDLDPNEALALVAGTRAQWYAMAAGTALAAHESVLARVARPSSTRDRVEAQRFQLLWIAGKLGPSLDQARARFDEAVSAKDRDLACILGNAVAYGLLSAGDFAGAVRYAYQVLAMTAEKGDVLEVADAQLMVGIIEQHAGNGEASLSLMRKCSQTVEANGSPRQVAEHGVGLAHVRLAERKFEQAADVLAQARRYFESSGGTRMLVWVRIGESTVHEALGEFERARTLLYELRDKGPEVGGHAAMAMIDDLIARVDCRLGEFDTAVDALARATVYRRGLGTVQSVYERRQVSAAYRTLRQKLDEKSIRRAYRRAALTVGV